MKSGIHPKQKEVTVVFPDGGKTVIKSCMKRDELYVETRFERHPAWNRDKVGVEADTQNKDIAKFNQRFGGVDFGSMFGGE